MSTHPTGRDYPVAAKVALFAAVWADPEEGDAACLKQARVGHRTRTCLSFPFA